MRLNFHFLGFLKKLAIFLILVMCSDSPGTQLSLILAVLVVSLSVGLILQTYKSRALNYLKIGADLCIVALVSLLLRLNDDQNSLEASSDTTEEELSRSADTQMRLGYICVGLELAFCLANSCLFALRSYYWLRNLKDSKLG